MLAGQPEWPEHGRAFLTQGIGAMFAGGEYERAIELFDQAYAIAERVGDRDGQILALSVKGRSFITSGDVEAGLALLDEATASAMCGDLRPHSAGLVYCLTISSCQDLGDYRRAAEWTEAANSWWDRLDVAGFPGTCRIHRAEVLRLRGDWPAAERQAIEACEELHDFDRNITAMGHYEIGEIRRRRGDFAGAEEAYRHDERARQRCPARACPAARRAGEGGRRRRGGGPLTRRRHRSAPPTPPAARPGRDLDRRRRHPDRTCRGRRARVDRRLVQDRRASRGSVRCDRVRRAGTDKARREGLGRRGDEPSART